MRGGREVGRSPNSWLDGIEWTIGRPLPVSDELLTTAFKEPTRAIRLRFQGARSCAAVLRRSGFAGRWAMMRGTGRQVAERPCGSAARI